MRHQMKDIQGDFKNIRFTMDKTFSPMTGFKRGWEELSNCKIMRRQFLLYNGGVCYGFYPISYRFFLFLFSGRRRANWSDFCAVLCKLAAVHFGTRAHRRNSR